MPISNLDGEQDSSDLQRGTPFVLEDVQADSAQLVDIGMVDSCDKPDLDNR